MKEKRESREREKEERKKETKLRDSKKGESEHAARKWFGLLELHHFAVLVGT